MTEQVRLNFGFRTVPTAPRSSYITVCMVSHEATLYEVRRYLKKNFPVKLLYIYLEDIRFYDKFAEVELNMNQVVKDLNVGQSPRSELVVLIPGWSGKSGSSD